MQPFVLKITFFIWWSVKNKPFTFPVFESYTPASVQMMADLQFISRVRHFSWDKNAAFLLLSLPINATRSNLMPLILVETTNSVPWQLLILAFLKYFDFRVNYFNWNRIMEANHIFKHRQALIRVHRDTWKWSFSWKSRSSGFNT